MTNTYLCVFAAIFCSVCTSGSFYHYYINRNDVAKRIPIHFGFSGEADNWSENRHAFKIYPVITLSISCLTVILAATLPFWPAVGLVLCMGSSIATIYVIQYHAILIANGAITRIPPLQYYPCLFLILISTVVCVVLSILPPASSSSSSASTPQ